MIYVFDATAFVAIWRESDRNPPVLDALGVFVTDGVVVFCDEVVGELERIADPILASLVRSMKRDRCDAGADYGYLRALAIQLPLLVDDEATGEEASLPTLAQAISLQDRGDSVAVVTDDYLDKPIRISLSDACRAVGMQWMLPRKCLDELHIEDLLA